MVVTAYRVICSDYYEQRVRFCNTRRLVIVFCRDFQVLVSRFSLKYTGFFVSENYSLLTKLRASF